MGTGMVVDVSVLIDGFASAGEGHRITRMVDDSVKKCCANVTETMIHVDTDIEQRQREMDRFKDRTREIIDNHGHLYLEVHKLDFHLSPDRREVHFHLVVPEGTHASVVKQKQSMAP